MPRVRDISFIRKLCGLGLPAQTVAQCLLPELRKFIPSHSAGVFWVDQQGEMASLYAERLLPPDAMAAYYERHYAVKTESFSDVFRRRAQSADPISYHSFSRAEQNTDYFRDVMGRLDAYHMLYGILKDGAGRIRSNQFLQGNCRQTIRQGKCGHASFPDQVSCDWTWRKRFNVTFGGCRGRRRRRLGHRQLDRCRH